VFDTDGTLVTEFGREGQGPGEFMRIYSIAWVGETLLTLDFGNGRIGELSADGEWVGQRPAPGRVSGSASMLRFYPVSDDRVIQWSLRSEDGRSQRLWIEHGPDGVVGEWPQERFDPPDDRGVVCNDPSGVIGFYGHPADPKMYRHPTTEGREYISWSASYRVALVGAEGDTLRVIEREQAPVPVSDSVWEAGLGELATFRENYPDASCNPRGFERPAVGPALRNLLVDAAGRLWVEAITPNGIRWEIFGADGRLVGSLPAIDYDDDIAPSIRGDLLAWRSTDELGVHYAHLARIVVPTN
jgi:hypothetical protein